MADRGGYAGRGGFSGRGGGPGVGNVSVAGNRVLSAQRGGALAARGRGGSFTSIRGGMGVGAAGAPRGPKAAPVRDSKASAAAPKRGPLTVEEKEKLKEKEKLATEEARRRTLTDFRIVGLEIKQLDWSWGQLRAEDDDEEEEEEEEREPAAKDEVDSGNDSDADNTGGHDEDEAEEKVLITAEAEVYDVVPQVAPVKATTDVKAEEEIKKEIKEEDAESAEVKRGEKRKAKMSSPEPGSLMLRCFWSGFSVFSLFSFSLVFLALVTFSDILQMTTSGLSQRRGRRERTALCTMQMPKSLL